MASSHSLTAEERSQRARIAAHALHAQGKTNTKAAREALWKRFEDEVDPDGVLDPLERAKRAEHQRRLYYTRLSYKASRARSARKQQREQQQAEGGA